MKRSRRFKHSPFIRLIALWAFGVFLLPLSRTVAQGVLIDPVEINENGDLVLSFPSNSDSYYILRRGESITTIATAADALLGTDESHSFRLDSSGFAAFFTIEEVSQSDSLDLDGDGLPDVYELRFSEVLNLLDSADAALDPDGDGFNNLQEFRQNTQPNVFDQPPEISIVSPSSGANFTAPTGIPLQVQTDDNVVQVEYFSGTESILTVTEPPFAGVWDNPSPAVHELVAIATTDSGLNGISEPITLSIGIPPPTWDNASSSVREKSVTLTGQALPGLSVHLTGLDRPVVTQAGDDGRFRFETQLKLNKRNRLFATASAPSGITSPPATIELTQDSQPPSLFVDFPEHNSQVTAESIVVAGRMGDQLSGFMGLNVTVNNEAANVVIGIGQNGTFERGNVPLQLGRNVITTTATDALGNTVTRQISVTRLEPSGALLRAAGGDAQKAVVGSPLTNPIQVQVTTESGNPIPNKIVTFQIVRSDGRLNTESDPQVNASMIQQLTDANGMASVRWIVGMDAGCANNRLQVSAKGTFGDVFFCASADPEAARQINIGSGNQQRAEIDSVAVEPLRVWVNDSCNGVEGVPVTFRVVEGSGLVNGQSEITVPTSVTGHAAVEFRLGSESGNQRVEATFPNNRTNPAQFVLQAVQRDVLVPTALSGLIIDNANQPVGGARCSVEVDGNIVAEVISDTSGQFRFLNLPAGAGHLHVDGLVADRPLGQPIAPGSFPGLTYELFLIPNTENTLPAPVLLPPLNPSNAQPYDGTEDIVLRVDGIDGLEMLVRAGSMRRADGSRPNADSPAVLSLNQVHHDDIPMPMPDGAAPPFAWTLQPAGATFDPPIQIRYPNMTGLAPGAIAYFTFSVSIMPSRSSRSQLRVTSAPMPRPL